jgi:hypothetical protein
MMYFLKHPVYAFSIRLGLWIIEKSSRQVHINHIMRTTLVDKQMKTTMKSKTLVQNLSQPPMHP